MLNNKIKLATFWLATSMISISEYDNLVVQATQLRNLNQQQSLQSTVQNLQQTTDLSQTSKIAEKVKESLKVKNEQKSETKAKVETKIETKAEVKAKIETKAKVETKSETKAKVETKIETKAEVKATEKSKIEIKVKESVKAEVKNENKVETKSENKTNEKQKVDEKSKSDVKSENKEKNHSKNKNKNKNKSKNKHKLSAKHKAEQKGKSKQKPTDQQNVDTETDKTLSERVNDIGDDEEFHISGDVLSEAAKQLEASQDDDLEELGILDHEGFGELTNGIQDLSQKKKKTKKKKSHKKGKKSLAQAAKENSSEEKENDKSEEKESKKNLSESKEDDNDDDKKASKKKSGSKMKKSVNQYANWWNADDEKNKKKEIVDSTPDAIKDNDVYQDMIARFMPENFKDKALQAYKNENSGNSTSSFDGVDDTKEWEGMYPTSLDQEMKGYKYGDKVDPHYNSYNSWDNNYKYNSYQNIYNKNTGYNGNNKWNKRSGWGFDEGNIAPKYDPNSHFESPYYDYDSHGHSNRGYWDRMKRGPWSNNQDQQKTGTAGGDSQEEKDDKKDSKDDKKKDSDKNDEDGDKKEAKKESTGIPELDNLGVEIKEDSGKIAAMKMKQQLEKEEQEKQNFKNKEAKMENRAQEKGHDIWDEIVNTVSNDKEFIAQVVGESTKDSLKNVSNHPVFTKGKKAAPKKQSLAEEKNDDDIEVQEQDYENVQSLSLAQGDDKTIKKVTKPVVPDTTKVKKESKVTTSAVTAPSSAKDSSKTKLGDDKSHAKKIDEPDGGDGGGEIIKQKPAEKVARDAQDSKKSSAGGDSSSDKKDAGKDAAAASSSNGAKDAADSKKTSGVDPVSKKSSGVDSVSKKSSEDDSASKSGKTGESGKSTSKNGDAIKSKDKNEDGSPKDIYDGKSKDKNGDSKKSSDKKAEASSDMKPGGSDSSTNDDDDSNSDSKDSNSDTKDESDSPKEDKEDDSEAKNKAVGSNVAGSPETPDEAGSVKTMTGVSSIQMTIENKDYAEELLHKLFKEHLIADAELNSNRVERLYMKFKKEQSQENIVKLHLVTADDRLPDLIRFLIKENPNSENVGVPDDIISTQMNGGSQEYVTWVKEQTRSPELDIKEPPKDTSDTQDSEDMNMNLKKNKKKQHKKNSKNHATAKSDEFNKTFHLAEVDEEPLEETDNYEYFE